MGRAVKVLELSPVTIEENLVYHVKLLLELGELPYLENDILEGKGVVDANNLDVLGVVVVVAAVVLWGVVGGVYWVVKKLVVFTLKNCEIQKTIRNLYERVLNLNNSKMYQRTYI